MAAASVCNSDTCFHCREVCSNKTTGIIRMKANPAVLCNDSNLRCVHNNRVTMSSRMASDVRSNSGLEVKGLVLLAVCGLYALFLFALGSLLSYVVCKISSTVKSVLCGVVDSEAMSLSVIKPDDSKNAIKQKRQQTRSISHG